MAYRAQREATPASTALSAAVKSRGWRSPQPHLCYRHSRGGGASRPSRVFAELIASAKRTRRSRPLRALPVIAQGEMSLNPWSRE
jgi:hypothetical protein